MQKCAICGAPYNDISLTISKNYICRECQQEDMEYVRRHRALITGKKYVAQVEKPVPKRGASVKKRKYKHCARVRIKSAYTKVIRGVIREEYDQDQYIPLLGCTAGEFIKHIESQFLPGMSWDNHNIQGWHIDHYIPYSFFDFRSEAEMAICWNHHNLRPLWGRDNLDKSTTVPADYARVLAKIHAGGGR